MTFVESMRLKFCQENNIIRSNSQKLDIDFYLNNMPNDHLLYP